MINRLAVALVAALALGACAQGTDGEQTTGSLTLYSGRDEALIGELVQAFTTETGIEVQVKYGETSELAATLAEEGDASPADLYWAQDGGALGAVEAEGLFATLPASITDLVDPRYRSPSGAWVGTSARVRVIAYSTERLDRTKVPTSIDELTEPRWKGKVGWAPTNGSFHAFVTALRLVDGEQRAKSWLEAMIANGAVSYPKNSVIALAINDGEVDLGMINHYYTLQLSVENPDLAVDTVFPRDLGGLANVAGIGILAPSEQTEAAQRFIEFLLGEMGQSYFVENTFEYPLTSSVSPDPRLPSLEDLRLPDVELASLTDLDGTLKLLADVGLL